MIRPGAEFDRYVVEAEIGRGGMAVVYRVRHKMLGSAHALKVLMLPSQSLVERVALEGKLQASFRHPNVVAVTDIIDVDGTYGLIMDLIDGVPLETWLEMRQPTLDQKLNLFKEIVRGVRAAHAVGIIHRDLKPGNVLVMPRDNACIPMVTDFGLAKALGSLGATMTRSNVSMGTPAYMAPEQIRDARSVDERADIFSLGAILYRMVCGRPAFGGEDVLSILYATTSGRYPSPEDLQLELPEAVVSAIKGSLVPQKDHRIPSCDALMAVLEGQTLPLPPPNTPVTVALPTLTPRDSFIDEPPLRREELPVRASPSEDSLSRAAEDWTGSLPPPSLLRRHGLSLALVVLLLILAGWALSGREGAPALAPETASQAAPPAQALPVAAPAELPAALPTPPSVAPEPPPAASAGERSTPTPSPAPSSRPSRGAVRVSGDARAVWLEGGGRSLPVNGKTTVEPGTYRVVATFAEAERVAAGELDVVAGADVQLSCQEAFLRCKVAP